MLMSLLAPLAFTLFVWWFSTGVILYLDGLPRRTFKFTMAASSGLAALGFVGLASSSAITSPASAYCAFACALLVWAWQEVAFLLGYVTGPRRTACPPETRGWSKARLAFLTIAHHELALVGLGAAVVAVTWRQPNQTGAWTFAILWAMRQSSKLNVFLGVRNLSDEFLPPHLAHLKSYFSRRAMNALWPISMIAATAAAIALWQAATSAAPASFAAAAQSLLATLLSLGIVEHLFLVLPLSSLALWRWGLRSHERHPASSIAASLPPAAH